MIALSPTDIGWFEFLRSHKSIPIVNFWTPTDWKVKSFQNGGYWYFVLKGKEPRKIGGYGEFVEYVALKPNEAWSRYGLGNGVASLNELVQKVNAYKDKKSTVGKNSSEPEIGCVLLKNCVFLDDHQMPTTYDLDIEFPSQIVKFKTFNLPFLNIGVESLVGEYESQLPISKEDARRRIERSIVQRQGQKQFRQDLLKAYNSKCAITGCDVVETLEAAHITPYLGDQTNLVTNGLILRADIHTLFDLGKIAISPESFKIILHPSLKSSDYAPLAGRMIAVPKNKNDWPSRECLKEHKEDFGL